MTAGASVFVSNAAATRHAIRQLAVAGKESLTWLTHPARTAHRGPSVATAGVSLFADALRAQAVPVTEVDWRPPLAGTEAALARVLADPRREAANALAFERLTTAGRTSSTSVPRARCWVWRRDSSSTPGRRWSGTARAGR